MSFCTYRFTSSSFNSLPDHCYQLNLRQQPQRAKISIINERDRRTIEPPPILQLQWNDCSPDETKKRLQCPFYFMVVTLLSADTNELLSTEEYLSGSTVSSLYRLRDVNDEDGGFFIFGDLYCKKQGHYKLKFSLFEILGENVHTRQTIISDAFETYLPKHYPGPVEATALSRSFSDQGVKLRIRKEHRSQLTTARKRKLDVQVLMENQSLHKNLKTIVSSPLSSSASPSSSFTRFQVIKQEPIKIAPAVTTKPHHHHDSISSSSTYHSNNDHDITDHHRQQHHQHTYRSPSINQYHSRHSSTSNSFSSLSSSSSSSSPSSSLSSSFKDELSLSLLDDYSLHLTSNSSCSSSTISSSSSSSTCSSSISSSSSSSLPHHSYASSSLFFSEHKENDQWGHSLPLLKPIMDGFTSRSATLLLPCPFSHHA